MRILHVLEPPVGGVPRHVRDLVAGQIAHGHDVQAIVSRRGTVAVDLRELGAGVVALDLRAEITALAADLRAARSLARLLRPGRWDIVHTHGNKAGAIARPMAAARGLTVVHTPHSFAYASQRQRPRRGQAARRTLTLGIERAASHFADVIVCVSEAERRSAIADRVAPAERLIVIPNGVSRPAEVRRDLRLLDDATGAPLIGFVARMHAGKGPQLLVEALARLRRSGIPFRAALVGDGPLADEVCRQVRRERLCDVVRVLPFGGDPWPVLAALDVYVLPSLWESMPIGVLEAMAAGLPVIAADTGGVAEAVVSGETGVLHLPGDVDGLVGALQRLLCQPELRRRMGQAGRRRQQERYSLEAMVEGTLAAYERAWTG